MSPVQRSPVVSRVRLLGFAAVILVVFSVYLVRIFQMQVLDGYVYVNRARQNAMRSEPVFAQRGQILDRSMEHVFAENESSFALTVIPGEMGNESARAVIGDLSETIGRQPEPMWERFDGRSAGAFRAVEIASGLTLGEVSAVAEHAERFPGVSWYAKPRRVYPSGDLVSHVVGYVGDITPEELQVLFNEGYSPTSVVGKAGVEQEYDGILRGSDGRRVRTVDARGRRVGPQDEITPPEQGRNIVLTIDRDLQLLSQQALGDRIGSVVAMRPGSGEILAMVSYPRFNPQDFVGIESEDALRALALDPRSPFLNRPIQSVAAPASTFKVIMTAAILEEEALPADHRINCTGHFDYGDRVFRDWLEFGHGVVDLSDALAQSCNVYYWSAGAESLSAGQIIDYSARLGLGRRTGVDLPGEVSGLVPSPAWKEQNFNTRWVGGDTVNMSIGEGFLQATPMQLASMVSTIVADGRTYRPHVLREIRDPLTGGLIRRFPVEILREAELSAETLEATRSAMRSVITDGTANVVITTDAVEVAGKTGTGQVGGSDSNFTSWFVAYAPYGRDVPISQQIVLVVMVDAANEWEWWAPKAANIILHGYFSDLGFEDAVQDLRQSRRGLWYM